MNVDMDKLLNKVANGIIPVILLVLVMAHPLHAYATTDVPGVKSTTPTPTTHEPKPPYALGFNAGYTSKTNDLCSVFSMKEYDNCINGFS
jgi:hypothetical protein